MSKEKLKPCPFCGEKRNLYPESYVTGKWQVECLICRASGGNCVKEANAIKAWNRRVK